MILLALDPSTTSTGYCIYDTDKKGIKAFGIIKPKPRKDGIDRIIFITNAIKDLIEKKKVEYVVLEELSSIRNGSVTKLLAGLQVNIEILLRKKDMLYITARPNQWRATKVYGRTREDLKKNAIEYVENKYKIKVTDDEADAILIAEYGSSLDIEVEEVKE